MSFSTARSGGCFGWNVRRRMIFGVVLQFWNESRLFAGSVRQASKPPTIELASTPASVGEDRQPNDDYLLFPKVSARNPRQYLPLGFLKSEVVANGSSLIVPNAQPFHFGVLSSIMHMAWMRQVAGRLESRYQYSNTRVYNNFPWPIVTDSQRDRINSKAKIVLEAREPHLPPRGTGTIADLYDPLTMPPPCRKPTRNLIVPWSSATARSRSAPTVSGWNSSLRFTKNLPRHCCQGRQRNAAQAVAGHRKNPSPVSPLDIPQLLGV